MTPRPHGMSWQALEVNAHRPEVQAVIRQAIQVSTVRVAPRPEGGNRILPITPEARPPVLCPPGLAQRHRRP
jgi:hypothetical protein